MMTEQELFETKVVPVMNRVRDDLGHKQAMEAMKFNKSFAGMVSCMGPDGGMAAHATALDSLKITGEWNSKTVEDYIEMVKDELRKEDIRVTPDIESMMIDKMVRDQMPKSSIEYIMRKAASNSIFSLADEAMKSPLQHEIEERGDELYGPTILEKGVGLGVGAAADFLAFGGVGGVGGALKFVGADLALNAVLSPSSSDKKKEEQEKKVIEREGKYKDVPLVVLPGHEEEWLRMHDKKDQTMDIETAEEAMKEALGIPSETVQMPVIEEPAQVQQNAEPVQEQAARKENTDGWQGVLTTFGLNGLGDIGRNAGYILAMLPDILVGMFTGRTKSLGLKDNMMPVASIIAGMFVKNPLLKMTLIGLGGANLINKAGHEELARRDGISTGTQFRRYDEEQLDPRIENPQLRGTTLIASIDSIPVTVTLPQKVVDAYSQGALPLNTLANAVLARCDQMQQIGSAQERFEEQSRTETRTLSQR